MKVKCLLLTLIFTSIFCSDTENGQIQRIVKRVKRSLPSSQEIEHLMELAQTKNEIGDTYYKGSPLVDWPYKILEKSDNGYYILQCSKSNQKIEGIRGIYLHLLACEDCKSKVSCPTCQKHCHIRLSNINNFASHISKHYCQKLRQVRELESRIMAKEQ